MPAPSFFIIGGYGVSPQHKEDAAKFNVSTNTWLPLPALPTSGRYDFHAVSTDTQILYWGGRGSAPTYKNDGGRYDIATNSWSAISSAGAPSARYGHALEWDPIGKKMIVWGGSANSHFNDGGLYDPATDSWTPLAAAPLKARRYAAHAFDPVGRRFYVWGGYSPDYEANGAYYDMATNKWTLLPAAPAGVIGRFGVAGAWAGGRFIAWGGYNIGNAGTSYLDDGIAYDPGSNTWLKMAKSNLVGRFRHRATVSGSRVLFFGGFTPGKDLSDGEIYNAATNSWGARGTGPPQRPLMAWPRLGRLQSDRVGRLRLYRWRRFRQLVSGRRSALHTLKSKQLGAKARRFSPGPEVSSGAMGYRNRDAALAQRCEDLPRDNARLRAEIEDLERELTARKLALRGPATMYAENRQLARRIIQMKKRLGIQATSWHCRVRQGVQARTLVCGAGPGSRHPAHPRWGLQVLH